MKRNIVTLIAFAISCFLCYGENLETGLTPHVFKTAFGEELRYQAYLPKENATQLPIVLFLHGAGERGSDNQKQTKHVVPELIHFSKSKDQPCIIIAPQCPDKQQWVNISWRLKEHRMPEFPSTPMRLALELLDETIAKYQADKNRVYVIGLSMGGYGTWDAIQRKQDFFAAAVPICGGGDTNLGHKLTKLPIWTWHGDKDGAVPVQRSRSMIESIKKAGGSPVYTELAGVGHNAWTPAAQSEALWEWLFSKSLK